jgi:hypothetical protein
MLEDKMILLEIVGTLSSFRKVWSESFDKNSLLIGLWSPFP